ncbi:MULTISPECIES: UvrD-helicase domain-containing protein [Streptomyces]|uniref:UvrD-helicase domain-containing protein n=1 Tax=Streptomyces sudanensis TaxID=436397 RepID=A0ABY4TFK7_9ACTN|nr:MULTISPECIES: UvrD-helicase domain-containing protein [Streptomyces]URN17709.1 UvrD-helicase domain-containing protein [Streptomyces sudanensis]
MISSPEDGPALTPEQQAVVDQPWDTRMLVTAGAGTGKTHTLVRRLDALVGHIDPEEALEASELLVLSFSRAAVRELQDRIARHGEHARRVRVQTFDSWAYSLLRQAYPESEWSTLSFDRRIRAATDAIEKGALASLESGPPAHVIVDEVQDLVGARREMVESLLDRLQDSCGFTLVGDSAQAIHDFQIEDPEEYADRADLFLRWVRASYADDLVELRLTRNFRALTPEARTALPLGPAVQGIGSAPEGADAAAERLHGELRELLLDFPDPGPLTDSFTLDSLRSFPGTCAILTRDNRQALLVSELLHTRGVRHVLRRSLQDRPVPYWVAELLRRTEALTLTEKRLRELLGGMSLPEGTDPDRVWRALRGVARGAGRGTLDVTRLRRLVAERRFPDELADPEPARLVVSTVHRSKGLEFDRVVLLTPPTVAELRRRDDELDVPAEARALYVAMTRAREDLYRVTPPDTVTVLRHKPTGRWYRGVPNPRHRWRRDGVEVRAGDVCALEPADAPNDPLGAQTYLSERVRPGDAVTFRLRDTLPMGAEQSPRYAVLHEGREIGDASEAFRSELYSLLKVGTAWHIRWPEEISGLRVDCLESVAGSTAAGANAGLGDHGVWIAPRLSGIGRFRWSTGIEEEQG